jgi:hypothetical protein
MSFVLDDLRNLHEIIVLANETTIVEVLSVVIDSSSPQDIDNPSKTENKEEKHVEKCNLSTNLRQDRSAASSINILDVCSSMMSGVGATDPTLLEIVRRLKERIRQREDQLEYSLLTSADHMYLPIMPHREVLLSRLSNQANQECNRQLSNLSLKQRQSVESQ